MAGRFRVRLLENEIVRRDEARTVAWKKSSASSSCPIPAEAARGATVSPARVRLGIRPPAATPERPARAGAVRRAGAAAQGPPGSADRLPKPARRGPAPPGTG